MKFHVPTKLDSMTDEEFYRAICVTNDVPPQKDRVYRLGYRHNGKDMVAEVGQPADAYYCELGPVVAILFNPSTRCYFVCLPLRGVIGRGPILVGASSVTSKTLFEP